MNNQELDKKIGGRISEFRKRINLTQEVLAERVAYSGKYYTSNPPITIR